jgi:8-oxo-dGTP diphosphatase
MYFGEIKPGIHYKNRKASYAVILDKKSEKVAVMIHNNNGFLPGGGVKPQETTVESAERECMEETGYALNIDMDLGNAKQYFRTRQMEYIMNDGYFYTGTFGKKTCKPLDDDHVLEWLNKEEAMQVLLHQSHKWAVQEAFKRLIQS